MAKILFNPKEWLIATLQWSERWKDKTTNLRGSGYYIADNGLSKSIETPEGNWLVTIDNVPDDQKPKTIMVLLKGGRATYEQSPATVYISTVTGQIMLVDDCKKLLAKSPTLPTEIAEQPNA